ncbi:MAG: carboxypeptidase regulatory-like domain-containing protein [Thermoplasmata archaeon]|nr:MAG: carboxypeptidase regulatory-like domain-containing protein [Thermoplasmata archaeon]
MERRSIFIGIIGLLVILGLLGTASLVAGQDHQVSGYVYEEGSYRTIDGAEVEIEGEGIWDTSYTDGSGYYSFWVEDGSYSVHVSANGYYDEDEWVNVDGEDVNQNFFLYEMYGDGNGGGGDGDGDGDEDSDGEDDGAAGEFGELGDQVMTYATICGAFFIILMVSLLVMAIASVGIFMRLGKIKKELKNNPIGKSAQQQPSYPAQQTQPQPGYNQPQQQPYTQPSQPQASQAPPPPGPPQ